MYYPTGGLKHRLCVDGRRLLYEYLQAHQVGHRRCGKLIVATSDAEIAQIEAIHRRGLANDVEGMELLSAQDARKLEPQLRCTAALNSSVTGIMDSHGYMLALQAELEDHGGTIALRTPILGAEARPSGFSVAVGGVEPTRLTARILINSAGLFAPEVALRIDGLDYRHVPRQQLAKGSYFSCSAKPAFSRLIYPAPIEGGLGVHVTLDLSGRMRFGPDVEWLNGAEPAEIDYRVDPSRAASFYSAVRRYWPSLPDGAIQPDYAGCRTKLSGPGEPAADFRIDGPEVHSIDGLVNLFGIESPGLTSSLAIARETLGRLG